MALVTTLSFLPDVFRSVTNQRFLGATLDHLASDSLNVPINGYIGRTLAPTYKLGDNYISEPTAQRKNYQLEPSVVIKNDNGDIVLNSEYIDLLQSITNNRGSATNHRRLFSSTDYNFDGQFDYDKFVNYNNYYWIPNGPAPVSVTASDTPLQADYTVTRNTTVGGYTFSGQGSHPNQQITLTRGGTYNFIINQPGFRFWIQSQPGITGLDPTITYLTTRDVYGVANNGTDNGVIQVNVPQTSAQDFYLAMPIVESVTAAATFNYSDIQNVLLSDFLTLFPNGIDGITNQLQNKTIIFINNETDNTKWQANGNPSTTVPASLRTSVWKINLQPATGTDYTIQLLPVITVNLHEKVFITSGKTYASTTFWTNTNNQYIVVPPITATLDYLYYQDSSNPEFLGQIKLVDNTSTPINVDSDIVGRVGYTSPTGVIFTNGLKIKFDSLVNPVSYANNEYYVEGVGTSIALVPVEEMTVPEAFGVNIGTNPDYITINRASIDRNPWSRSNCWFHKDVLNATATYNQTDVDLGPNIYGRRAIIEFDSNLQLFNFGKQAKDCIDLICFDLPATQIVTGGNYKIVTVGTTNFTALGATSNTVGTKFVATRNGTASDGTGTTSTDAFVQIAGPQTVPAKKVDGVTLTPGMRVVFANDYDMSIENQVWLVDFETINSQIFIRLLETTDDPVLAGESVTATKGVVNGAKTFWFDGVDWYTSQEKYSVQQAPLFDLVDAAGYSFSDATIYPNSTFTGTKLFGYPVVTTGTNDPILGFPLKYQNFNNIGDIVFANYYDTDTFTYTPDTNTGVLSTIECDSGYIVYNSGLTTSIKLTNWIPGIEKSDQYQIITKFHEGYVLDIDGINYPFVQIDVLPDDTATVPHLKVYLNNNLLDPNTDYQLVPYGVYHVITLNVAVAIGDKIDVAILSSDTSTLGYYEIPKNLNYNPLNKNFSTITLGQLRTHYNKLLENTSVSLTTSIPSQDMYIKAQGGTLLQQSSPLIYAMTFLADPVVNFVNGITLAREEYTRFKNKFLNLCITTNGLNYNDPVSGVDTILQTINLVKNSSFPWYYSDMVPQGGDYNTISYTVLNTRQKNYEISSIFDVSKLSNRAVLVYHNGVQLIGDGVDFTCNPLAPEVIINISLTYGDKIVIRDYFNTDGNWIPETPAKLGLQQDHPPEIFLDDTYLTPINAIRGHDGSITPAFNDFRDDYLLELEKRIYNNIKTYNEVDIFSLYDTVPGRFRATDYSLEEWNQLLTTNFLQWVGTNNVDYTTNKWFDANNPWTWNYNQCTDSVNGSPLQGSWKAIYNYWYDTEEPHRAPWKMLGITEKPMWWETRYGPAPYTSGNDTLWGDLEAGYIWNNGNSYTDVRFARAGLSKFIPVDSAGNLLDPTRAGVVGQIDTRTIGNSFRIGDQGPVETAWRRSSDYSFSMQQALAIARPADYFSSQIDLSRFNLNPVTGQFSDSANRRLTPSLLAVNGDTTTVPGTVQRTAGYLNWIADYIKNLGMDPVTKLESYFRNFNVQLAYRVAGFTDQNLITVTAEQTSPGSTNASIIIPDGNYSVYLNKSVPTNTITYSAVIVTKVETGYSVAGYDTTNPYFTILPSIADNNATPLTVNDITVNLYSSSNQVPRVIPYGTTFSSAQQVSDFLVSYQRHLISQGFEFNQTDSDLQQTRDWTLSISEFLFWIQQGFGNGVLIVLNPVKNVLDVSTQGTVIDAITNLPNGSKLLDTNFNPIVNNNFNVLRVNSAARNRFQVTTVNGLSTIAFAKLDLVQYESTLIFDNVDTFGDIIYIPEQGTRQFRLKLTGAKTGLWDGALNATGYIYNDPVISTWQPGVDYKQGDVITFNGLYYTAPANIVAKQSFNVADWKLISLSDLQTGLLPSFGHNAQIFESIYNIDVPPLDENFQTFSAGLIGFRERPFLSNLGMSVPTQTKFYQGYIHQKGTQNAITALTKATFDSINSTVSVFEEWAFQSGLYGALDTNQYTEFVLDQSLFTTNPVAFTSNTAHSTGNIIVNLNGNAASHFDGNLVNNSDVYNSSNIANTNTTLYNNRVSSTIYPADLPSCGYVNLADVDYQIFDITAITVLPTLTAGEKIWVAKDATPGWNVYRVNATGLTATTLTYTLGTTVQLTFDTSHSFTAGSYCILQGFDDGTYDSLYQVQKVIDTTSISINVVDPDRLIQFGGKLTGLGTVFGLSSLVIDSYSQISSILPSGGWINDDRVWVNADTQPGATGWAVYTYNGATWSRTRQQSIKVDITSINRTFIYNKSDNIILAALDYIDPAKGKVLNTVGIDIDYQLTQDPALYNTGNLAIQPELTIHSDYHWSKQQVGKIWWNLDLVRYIDYEQDALIYRLNHWGEAFSGSQIAVYEWVESTVPPSRYISNGGTGTPLYADDSAYSTYGSVGPTGIVTTTYYFWVENKTTVNTLAGKVNSVYSIAAAIANPQAQGTPYAMILRDDTVALFNVNGLLTGKNSVIHLGSRSNTAGVIHSEYELVQEGNPQSQLPAVVKQKLIDSLVGQDSVGNPVPDPSLTLAQAYGISIRPRQSMFVNRSLALSNYLSLVNSKLLTYPIIERKLMTTLNSEEAIPGTDTGQYDQTVATRAELDYVDTALISAGYKILVTTDITQSNKWSIYTWNGTAWSVVQTQSYKTNLYWAHVDWYHYGYDYTVAPDITVDTRLDFGKLNLVAGTHIKVLNNGNNQFEVYYIDSNLTQNLVGLQNGTLQISTGTIPALELRQITRAMQNDIFIDDLILDYNQIFFSMIKYALSEQKNIEWVFKTSFLSATQYIRSLTQFPSYISDNQSYYLDYIDEVKPYRTTVREFIVNYQGSDQFGGDISDFDLPPYWDSNVQIYRSPNGSQPYDNELLSSGIYSQWSNNYKYKVVDVIIEHSGTGYLLAPQIIISGGGGTGATAYSTLNGLGGIASIIVTNPGKDYISDPTIIINGTGTGAAAYPILRGVFDNNNQGHNVVRSINTTIAFDRINYTNPNVFVAWNTITANANLGNVIPAGTIISLDNNFYQLANDYTITGFTSNNTVNFPSANVVQISSNFNNANDRIVAFNGNVDLRLTQRGLEYPGVTVDGNTFTGNIYDSMIQSRYTDSLGISPNDIFIDGGKYIDIFESYAPEELVPGRMYDSLDLIVTDTDFLGFRLTEDMNHFYNSYRIAGANTTVLTSNLALTDTTILVANASKLPLPSSTLNEPGVVFINGEKIVYWRNYALEYKNVWAANIVIPTNALVTYSGNLYLTTGNVYGSYFANIISNVQQVSANTIAQIRRAVDGTSPQLVHAAGSRVVDSSGQQLIPSSANSNVVVSVTTTYTSTDVVSLGISLTGNISANIGDTITQVQTVDEWKANTNISVGSLVFDSTLGNSYTVTGNVYGATFASILANVTFAFTGNNTNISTMTILETVSNVSLIPTILQAGVIRGSPVRFDSTTNGSYDAGSFSITNTLPNYPYINGFVSTSSQLPTLPQSVTVLKPGNQYKIVTVGTTDWSTVGANAVANVYGNITNGTTYSSAGIYLTANVLQSPQMGNIAVGTRISGTGITAGTYVTGANTQVIWSANTVITSDLVYHDNDYPGNLTVGYPGNVWYAPQGNIAKPLGYGNVYVRTGNVFAANIDGFWSPTVQANLTLLYANVAPNWIKRYTVSSSQLVSSRYILGQPAAGTQFVATAPGSGTGTVTVGNTAAFVTTDTNDTWVWMESNSSFVNIGPYTSISNFDNIVGTVHVNGVDTGVYVINSYILGDVDSNGQVTIVAGNILTQSNIWYSPGLGTITNGLPLVNSTTTQAEFLKASRAV